MKLSPEIRSVGDMIARIDEGRLGLPQFQRDFVWRPPQVVDLLVSVARRWPTGTFLFLEGPQEFAARPLDEAPSLTSAEELILDGQQRMTALYHALGDRAEDLYTVNFGLLSDDVEELPEEAIFSTRRSRFTKKYPTVRAWADQRLAPVAVVHDDSRFFEWLLFLPEPERKTMIAARDRLLSGLKSYDMPVVRLPRDVSLAALAKIFETINRTGVRLSAFDLMVARLYPHDFNLADEWSSAVRQDELLTRYAVNGIEILKLIALQDHLRPASDFPPVRGVRESDVLSLRPRRVIENWQSALSAYSSALCFLRDECGVVDRNLLPSTAQVLPLASRLAAASDENRPDRLLRRWFWATSFTQAYAQGANTQAVADARMLKDVSAHEPLPRDLEHFSVDEQVFLDGRRRNEMFLRAMLAMLVRRGAQDLATGRPLATHDGPLELHHVFSPHHVAAHGHDPQILLNHVLLTPASQRRLALLGGHGQIGLDVEDHVDEAAADSQLIDLPTLRQGDWPRFRDGRFRALLNATYDLLEDG